MNEEHRRPDCGLVRLPEPYPERGRAVPYFFSCVCVLSYVLFFVTPWAVAHQAPLSMGFSRQEYWSELPFPRPGDLPDLGTEPVSLTSPLQANSLPPATGEASCQFKTPGGQAREVGLVLSALLVFGVFFFLNL